MPSLRRLVSLFLAVCLLTSVAIATAPQTTMMNMPLVAPLFIEDDAFSSTMVIVNASNEKTSATVIFRSLAGTVINQRRSRLPRGQRSMCRCEMCCAR